MIADKMFPVGTRVRARFPSSGPDGSHEGEIIAHREGQHTDMVRIRFDNPSLANRSWIAAIYVEKV